MGNSRRGRHWVSLMLGAAIALWRRRALWGVVVAALALTVGLAPLFPPPSERLQEMVETIREPEAPDA